MKRDKVLVKKVRGKETFAAEKRGEICGKVVKSWQQRLLLAKTNGGGPTCSTPVRSWKGVEEFGGAEIENTIIKGSNNNNTSFSNSFGLFLSHQQVVSARKLCAVLWEFQQYYSDIWCSFSVGKMYLGVNNHHQRVRRHHHHRVDKDEDFDHHHQHHHDHQQLQHHHQSLGFDPQSHATPDHHPASAGSLRRQIAASLMRHHQSAERKKHAMQPLSPASYGSSLEIAPYNPAATPDSSIELRGRMGEPSYSFKTSTELLVVLNRIWSLEEQHSSNVSLVKGLKNELSHARTRIKELLRDQQANRHEIDQLVKQISEDSSAWKNKDHERTDAALQSVRDELEDERRLRKRSESLHRKLARELFEVKVALSTTAKEFEKEKASSDLLEELCDEFAKGIRDYAKQLHAARQKSDKDWTGTSDRDNLILHMSESWLDERTQVKDRDTHGSIVQRQPVADKLRNEIEAFFAAKQILDTKTKDSTSYQNPKESRLRRLSLESIPEAGTAPQDSAFTDSHGVEVSKADPNTYEEQEVLAFSVRRKGQSPPSVQMSDLQNTPREFDAGEATPTEISMLQKSDIYDSMKEQRKKAYDEEGHGSNTKTVDKLTSELLLSEGGSVPPDHEYKEVATSNPVNRRNVSPIRLWMASMSSPVPRNSESSSKLQTAKDNSLKARLQEPKAKGQRSRLKILKGSS